MPVPQVSRGGRFLRWFCGFTVALALMNVLGHVNSEPIWMAWFLVIAGIIAFLQDMIAP
jgi:hypothetical protein